MNRGRAALSAAFLGLLLAVTAAAGPAAANHDDAELEVIIALNAAGGDKITVYESSPDPVDWAQLAGDVAAALDQSPGSFRATEGESGGIASPNAKLAQPDRRGGFSYAVDSGRLQVLARQRGYDAVVLIVCTPTLRLLYDTLVAPQSAPGGGPGSRCRGWYQPVEDPPIRAVVQLRPDRGRYPAALVGVVGAAAISLAILGLGASLLRRGPLRQRSLGSWLLGVAAVVVVAPVGWTVVSGLLWIKGTSADAMLLGGGTTGDQVARILLPGLAMIVPALLPAVVLLSAPRKPRLPAVPPAPVAPPSLPAPTWWPTAWWQQWAAQSGAGAPPSEAPPPIPSPPVPPAGSGWTPPGGN